MYSTWPHERLLTCSVIDTPTGFVVVLWSSDLYLYASTDILFPTFLQFKDALSDVWKEGYDDYMCLRWLRGEESGFFC